MQTLKSLLVTLLILGGAFLVYDRYVAPESDRLVFKKPQPPPEAELEHPTPPPPSEKSPQPQTSPAPPPEVPKAEIAKTATPTAPAPAPASVASAASGASTTADPFVPPPIPPVEDVTQNWSRIPPTAFPRPVKLLQAVTFKATFGNTQVAAGATVVALAAQQSAITIAPNATSTLRAVVPIDSTDLKSVLTQVYEAWRMRRIADARRSWEERGRTPAPAPPPSTVDPTGRPQRGTDGSYPLLLASMKSGVVTEITPQSITRWGDAEKGEVNGKPCWNVPVEFDAATAFGRFHTEAFARVVEGRVSGWYYKGSGEVVP